MPTKTRSRSQTGKERYRNRLRARRLRNEGLELAEICERLQIDSQQLADLLSERRPQRNSLNRASWAAYLGTIVEADEDGRQLVRGQPICDEASTRALYRWKREGVTATIWAADGFLMRFGLHLEDFFLWCEQCGFDAWPEGMRPAWMTETGERR